MIRGVRRSACLALAFVVAACQPEAARDGARPGGDEDLGLSLSTDRLEYAVGQPVVLTLSVRNPSGEAAVLRFATAQRYDFVVSNRAGLVMWQWSADRTFAQAAGELTVPAGWEVSYAERLTERLPTGVYRVVGRLTADGLEARAVANFAVR